ncbi:hypothetical protein K7G98_34150, partial [Saccharothrix sp. MB29]|nr:hypothetical protein [Saccharothrix sp. MB29]
GDQVAVAVEADRDVDLGHDVGAVQVAECLFAAAGGHKFSAAFANAFPSASPHISAAYESGAIAAVLWPDNTITEIPQIYSPAISL